MAMYAIGIIPLIHKLSTPTTRQIWYADDASAAGSLHDLRLWWDNLAALGPSYGYYPNAIKTWLLVKETHLEDAKHLFNGSNISITSEGRHVLGCPIGSDAFVKESVSTMVSRWLAEIDILSEISTTHPQAAYSAFVHGFKNKWTYLSRTCPNIDHLFQPLEDVIHLKFIPSLTGRVALSKLERDLFSLPIRLGGMGIVNPCLSCLNQYNSSVAISAPLVRLIINQSVCIPAEVLCEQAQLKSKVSSEDINKDAAKLREQLPAILQRQMDLASDKGASSWLSVLPLREHGFDLHKGSFRDALCLRYGWHPPLLPTTCVCNKSFTVEHALSCPRGGYPILRHNELRDITAQFLDKICPNVIVEPTLQPLSGESLSYRTSNTEDGARLDVAATSFWDCHGQSAFFDVRVFNPLAQTHVSQPLATCYRKHEREKRRIYEQRVRDVEHGCFSPLVFNTSGGMGPTATTVYKRIASLISEKYDRPYSNTIRWIRCRLNFSLLRSTIMCLRGSRSLFRNCSISPDSDIDLALHEGRVAI